MFLLILIFANDLLRQLKIQTLLFPLKIQNS